MNTTLAPPPLVTAPDILNSSSSSGSQLTRYSSKSLRLLGIDCERFALVEIYNQLDGPNWKRRDNWLSDKPVSQWLGVKCEDIAAQPRVTQLDLRSNGLTGHVPTAIGYLEFLDKIDFSFNELKGNAVDFLSRVPSLIDAWLVGNPGLLENYDSNARLRSKEMLPSSMAPRFDVNISKDYKKVARF